MSEAAAPASPAPSQQQPQKVAPRPGNAAALPQQSGTQPPQHAQARATPPPERGEQTQTPEPRKFKLNVDGEERELDEATLSRELARLQKDYAADKRFKEAARLRQEAEAREARLKNKDTLWDELKAAGHDPRALSEEYLYRLAQEQMMSPEQRERAELQRQVEEFKRKEQVQQEEQRTAKEKAEIERHKNQLADTFTKALAHVGIALDGSDPLAPWALGQLAMLEQANGDYNAPPELLATELQEQMSRASSLYLGKLDGEPLLGALEKIDPELVKRINRATIARLETGRAPKMGGTAAPRQVNGKFAPNPDAPAKNKAPMDWNRFRLGLKK